MSFLFVFLDATLQSKLIKGEPGELIRFGGDAFIPALIPADDLVFYDWLASPHGAIRGLEIHVSPDHGFPGTSLRWPSKTRPSRDVFPQIWFSHDQKAAPQGKEAFGDIGFYASKDGRLAVGVGIDDWLSPTERDLLLRDLGIPANQTV